MTNPALDSLGYRECRVTSWAIMSVVRHSTLRDYSAGEVQGQAQSELPSALFIQSHGLVYGPVIAPVALYFLTREILPVADVDKDSLKESVPL